MTNLYDLERLTKENTRYAHQINEKDVEKVNELISLITNGRSDKRPMLGDIVEYTTENGDYYKNAHIEQTDDTTFGKEKTIYVCEKPYIPFVSEFRNSISFSTSGGAWSFIPKDLKLIGQRTKIFCTWGSYGACGNGAVYFTVAVNVWEYIEPNNKYAGLSTKTHDKFYIYKHDDNTMNSYKYTTSIATSTKKAFKTDEEFEKWLADFRGIKFKGNFENQIVVFTPKE